MEAECGEDGRWNPDPANYSCTANTTIPPGPPGKVYHKSNFITPLPLPSPHPSFLHSPLYLLATTTGSSGRLHQIPHCREPPSLFFPPSPFLSPPSSSLYGGNREFSRCDSYYIRNSRCGLLLARRSGRGVSDNPPQIPNPSKMQVLKTHLNPCCPCKINGDRVNLT